MPTSIPRTAGASSSERYSREQLGGAASASGHDSPDSSMGLVVQAERLLRLRDVLAIVGLSRAHVYNLVKQELFPRPIALGSNCARWVQSEVQTWVGNSIQAARSTPEAERVKRARCR